MSVIIMFLYGCAFPQFVLYSFGVNVLGLSRLSVVGMNVLVRLPMSR